MSFYEDFLALVEDQVGLHSAILRGENTGVDPHTGEAITKDNVVPVINQLRPFSIVAQDMARAKIVRMRADQTAVFLDAAPVAGQDYLQWLRLPFPSVYIQPEQPVQFHGYVSDELHQLELTKEMETAEGEEQARLRALFQNSDPLVRGMVITELEGKALEQARIAHVKGGVGIERSVYAHPDTVRIVQTVFLMPLPGFMMNIHGLSLAIMKDNTIACEVKGHPATRARMQQWLIHTINFLSSPSVKLVANAPSPALQKARQRSGKRPLPGWYEITYRRHVQEYSRGKIVLGGFKQWEHSFRYDVHGHFKSFTRGPMAGRVLWCPPHQRGLKHSLYKPKGYRQEGLK